MSEVSTIYQCFACNRQHDGMGGLLTHRLVVPVLRDCGRADCAEVCDRLLQQEAERRARMAAWKRVKARMDADKRECRKVQDSRLKTQDSRLTGRMPYKDDEREIKQSLESEVLSLKSPVGQSATDFGTSANGVLLAFFKKPENFNKPFLSSDLEDLTRVAGHPSTRMNNRAIWLRENLPAGWYLDNDPNGAAWGLARGSWYKVCFIEDATSLTEAEKHALLVKCGLRPDEQGEFLTTPLRQGYGAARE